MEKKAVFITSGLILLILLLSVVSIIRMKLSTSDNINAEIYRDGILIEKIDLSAVTDSYELTVNGTDDSYNTICVEPGQISMKAASCPDKLCVHMGSISNPSLPITCLPNKVIIRISNDDSNETIDAVAH